MRIWIPKKTLKIVELFIMSLNNEKVYYAVGRGRQVGIFDSWSECKAQTEGVHNSKYRKFYSLEDAQEFVNFWKNYSTPEEKTSECKNVVEPEVKEEKNNESIKICINDHPVGTSPRKQEGISSFNQEFSSLLPPSSPHSTSFEGRCLTQQNVDILALSLRLDSFEKRFDACLKDLGAMSSEISHLRSDIKELKESLKCLPFSPKKGKDGLLQTTLNFGCNSASNPVRCYSRRSSSDSDEPKKKKKCVKRKLSRSESSDNLKRSEKDPTDDLIANMKAEGVDLTSFTVDEEGFVEVYTDGSAPKNGKEGAKAGIGIWFGDNHPLNVAEAVIGPPTCVMAEIQAARVAMQLAVKFGIDKLKIFTDSEFLVNCATKWIHRWKKNGWTLTEGGPVKNRKELEKLDKFMSKVTVRWEKVPGHANIKGNETADRLANEGAAKYKR